MTLTDWACKWGINPDAIADLQALLTEPPEQPKIKALPDTEAEAQKLVQMEASTLRMRLWRNNVGAAMTDDGRLVRYGLANVSKAVNARIKSSDLIGVRPLLIEPRHVGTIVGQFTAREIKAPGWKFGATPREAAQQRFLELVLSLGGDAAFATGPGTL